ncbi:hypothetical protein P3S68_018796 [Capsicum galapagoense]
MVHDWMEHLEDANQGHLVLYFQAIIKLLHAPKEAASQDGSAIYGNNAVDLKKFATLGLDFWLYMLSLFKSTMLTVCDALKKEYQELKHEDLYRHARLVTSVVIAKVHTIDWSVEILKTDTLQGRNDAYGLLGKKFKDMFGHIGRGFMLSGYLGMKKPENHGMPYSLTEEFVRVYRMHQLLPDALQLRNINATPSSVTWRIFVQHNVHLYLLLCSTIK